MALAADIAYNQRMFWGKRDYWFQPLCEQLGWDIKDHFNCSVFPKVNQTFWIVKEFIKGWEKLKNNAHFCLYTRIYDF